MTFAEWLALTDEQRERDSRSWRPFEPGYWHALALEAAARFKAEFGKKRHVTHVYKSLYRARDVIIAVQTDLAASKKVQLPAHYCGIKVVQFAGVKPEGVLTEVGPPSKISRRAKKDGAAKAKKRHAATATPTVTGHSGTHRVVALEGEVDLHAVPALRLEVRDLIKAKPVKLVFDLKNMTYIDSSGLALLIDAMQKVEAYRGNLYLVGMSADVRTIFETSRLDQVFRIQRDLAAAIAAP